MNNIFFDKRTINIILMSLVSLIEALQVLIIIALIFSFIPYSVAPFVKKLFPINLYDVHMEREIFFYHAWIAAALALQAFLMFLHRKNLAEDFLGRSFKAYAFAMAGLMMVQIFAVFKIFLWGDPRWARYLFYTVLGFGIFIRIFWPEFRRILTQVYEQAFILDLPRWGCFLMEAGGLVLLMVLVFIPDHSKVLARMFAYDKFYHLDSFIMSPAWSYHNGLTLNKDVISEYSLTIPIIFDGLMKGLGGFSYAHAVRLMIALSGLYYLLLYGIWRYWTGSFWLSFFAILLSLKLQFFHWGVIPLIWIYPSATPLRFLPDALFLFCLLRYTQELDFRWLLATGVSIGFGLAWTMDVGSYMYVTYLVAIGFSLFQKKMNMGAKALVLGIMPWLVAFGILSIFYGPLILQNSFWRNTYEFASFFLQGWGALPITDGLKDKQFFAFCVGFVIPLVYLGSLLYGAAMFIFRESRRHLFSALISIYGLGLYHYFIHRSAVTSYYAVVIPFIFIILFWAQAILKYFSVAWQKGLKLLLCLWAGIALMTGYLFMYYPNVLNLSAYDWSGEKKFYEQAFDFRQDASLIDALTQPGEPVALISSFETKILIQANRQPFFYYFPMMESEHMQGEKLRGLYLHTYARLLRTLKELQEKKPAHIFIQSRLWEGPEGEDYERNNEGYKQMMLFIRLHYQYETHGQYLTALKMK